MQTKHGSALITALFIMTLVAIAATAMSKRVQLEIYRTELMLARDQLHLGTEAVNFWAMDLLKQKELKLTKLQDDGSLLKYPNNLKKLIPGIQIDGRIYDLQAKFNINNLQHPKFYLLFFKLLGFCLGKSEHLHRQKLMYSLHYWISAYQGGQGQDEELSYYLKQRPPYLPANQFMQNVSELRLVRGINQKVYQQLLPCVTALPEITAINLNTAVKPLLQSLGKGLNESQINELLAARGENGIEDIKDITPFLLKTKIPEDQITLVSTYFLVTSRAKTYDHQQTNEVVLKRKVDQKGNITVSVVR
jgi:general secretion pathway protein K